MRFDLQVVTTSGIIWLLRLLSALVSVTRLERRASPHRRIRSCFRCAFVVFVSITYYLSVYTCTRVSSENYFTADKERL